MGAAFTYGEAYMFSVVFYTFEERLPVAGEPIIHVEFMNDENVHVEQNPGTAGDGLDFQYHPYDSWCYLLDMRDACR